LSDTALSADLRLAEASVHHAEQNVAWILAHPAFSDWLKETLRSALTYDPLQVANDLELLNHVVRAWSLARIDAGLLGARARSHDSNRI
jgi:acyl-CoA hydrolase